MKQFHYLQNFTGKKFSVAYSYNFYLDQVETSQPTGTIYLQFNRLEILSENDILGKPSVDKFRTGSFRLAYNFPEFTLAINALTWTGNPKGVPRSNDPDYRGRWGYKDLSEAKYGKYSHGIVALSVERTCFSFLPQNKFTFSNNSLQIGIDSEYIRHFMQNILIHDFYFVPKKWNKARNPHYPMLMENGEPYLFKNGQKVKPMKFYFNFGSNSSISY